jgi:hypothetical protein
VAWVKIIEKVYATNAPLVNEVNENCLICASDIVMERYYEYNSLSNQIKYLFLFREFVAIYFGLTSISSRGRDMEACVPNSLY